MNFRSALDNDFKEIGKLANANGLLVEGLHLPEFIAMMNWQYNLPTIGQKVQIIYSSSAGEVIGHYGAVPFQFIKHNEEIMGALAGNLVISKDSRHGGIFYNLQIEFAKKCEQLNYFFAYGFITRKGVLEPHLRLGWKNILDLHVYVRPISSVSILEKLLHNPVLIFFAKLPLTIFDGLLYLITNTNKSNILIQEIDEFDSSFNQFLEEWNRDQEFTSKRDISILNWRFFSFKERKYKVFVATRGGEKCGFMVLRTMNLKNFHALALVDLIVAKNDGDIYEALLGMCIKVARSEKVDLVATVVAGNDYMRRQLFIKGFIRTRQKFSLVVRGFKKNGFNLDSFKKLKWFLTWFDHDTV